MRISGKGCADNLVRGLNKNLEKKYLVWGVVRDEQISKVRISGKG